MLGRQLYRDYCAHTDLYNVYGIANKRVHIPNDNDKTRSDVHSSVIRCDISDYKLIKRHIIDISPDIIIYCVSYRASDNLSTAIVADNMKRINVDAASNIFQIAQSRSIFVIYISCDQVFDGKQAPYKPADTPTPINATGIAKLAAEQQLWSSQCNGCVLRVSALYGHVEQLSESTITNIANDVLLAAEGKVVESDNITLLHPLHISDVSNVIQLITQQIKHNNTAIKNQIFHFGGQESYTRYSIAKLICGLFNIFIDDKLIAASARSGQHASSNTTTPYNTRLDNSVLMDVLHIDQLHNTPLIDGLRKCTLEYMPGANTDGSISDMDLPLRLCLMILKSTAPEMQNKYNEYVRTKQRRNAKTQSKSSIDQPLTFNQFLFTSTIRNYGADFVYSKPELAYYMITDSSTSELADKGAFTRYAPILQLASKLDAGKLFDALSLIHTDNKQDVDGIDYSVFAQYVESMRKQRNIEIDEWPNLHNDFSDIGKNDALLCVRNGILDSSGFPALCRIALTTNHFITETSLLRRRRCYKWCDVKSIEKISASFLRADSKFLMKFNIDGKIEERTLDAPGMGNELVLQRQRTFAYISDMITAHKLANTYKQQHFMSTLDTSDHARAINQHTAIVANAIIHETSMTIKRMMALESVRSDTHNTQQKSVHCESLLLDPFVHGSQADESTYIASISELVNKSDEIRKNKDAGSSWLGVIPVKNSVIESDIDPELSVNTQYNKLIHNDVAVEEAFSVARTSANLKLTRQLIDPLLIGWNLLCALRDWDQPYVSGIIMFIMLQLAYKDACNYIPALIVLANVLIIVALKYYPELMPIKILQPPSVNTSHNNSTSHPSLTSPSSNSIRSDSVDISVHSNGDLSADALESGISAPPAGLLATYNKHKEGLLEKFKQYKTTALAGYAGMCTAHYITYNITHSQYKRQKYNSELSHDTNAPTIQISNAYRSRLVTEHITEC